MLRGRRGKYVTTAFRCAKSRLWVKPDALACEGSNLRAQRRTVINCSRIENRRDGIFLCSVVSKDHHFHTAERYRSNHPVVHLFTTPVSRLVHVSYQNCLLYAHIHRCHELVVDAHCCCLQVSGLRSRQYHPSSPPCFYCIRPRDKSDRQLHACM